MMVVTPKHGHINDRIYLQVGRSSPFVHSMLSGAHSLLVYLMLGCITLSGMNSIRVHSVRSINFP
jgi:hypothetical protein